MASLLALSRAASEEAKRLLNMTVWAHASSLAFAAVALRAPRPWGHVCAVLALIAEAVAWAIRYRALGAHQAAERARRGAMLMWAFGSRSEPLDAVDLRAAFDPQIERRANALEDPNYYSSCLPAGQARFVDMLQESAFWSKHLYRQASWITLWSCALVFLGATALFVLLEPTAARGVLAVLAEIMVPITTFFISLDLLGQGLAWRDAADTADRVDRALESSTTASQQDLLAMFSEYSVATTGASPIPTFLYRREHNRLNREWDRRRNRG